MTISSPTIATRTATPLATPLDRAGSSNVRCGRCGGTQSVDLSRPVLTQVRPFVQAHLSCGPATLSGPEGD